MTHQCRVECTPEAGSYEAGKCLPRRWRKVLIFLGNSAASSHSGGFSSSFLAQGFALCTPGEPVVSCLRAESSLLAPSWFADERDPTCYRLHQAQPLGQKQPLRTPRGPVCRVSRETEDPASLLLRTPPPAANRTQATLCLCLWDPLLITVWTRGSQPRESCPHL